MSSNDAKFLSVVVAIEKVTGVRVSPATAWRWHSIGSRGVKLKTWTLGSRRFTTLDAVTDFIASRSASEKHEQRDAVRKELDRELSR